MYDVYAYWNVTQLVAIFNGIAAIAGQTTLSICGPRQVLIIAAIASLLRCEGGPDSGFSRLYSGSSPESLHRHRPPDQSPAVWPMSL
jgi:hypothetical protein